MRDGVLIHSMARRIIPKNEISQELKDLTDDRLRDLRRPRIVMFYKNADRYFKGKTLHITPHRYLHFDELLTDLSKSMSLPYGVRRIYTPIGGTLVEDIEELKDGESYVCASFEKFHRIKYGQYSDRNHLRYRIPNYSNGDPYGNFPHTTTGTGRSALRSTFPPSGGAMFRPASFKAYPKGTYPQPTQSGNSPTKPKMITVVRLGPSPPYNKITILLNRRSVQTFEQLLADISDALAQPKWNGIHVRRLYTLKGREVRSVSDFFRDDDVFIAVGKEQLTAIDIQDVMQELYPDSPYTENLIRHNLQKSSKHQGQSKRYSDRTKGSKTDSLSGDSMRFVEDQQQSGRKYRSRNRLVVDQRVKEQERLKAKQWEKQRWEKEKEELDEELRRRHGNLELSDDEIEQTQRDKAGRKKERLQWNLEEQRKKRLEEEKQRDEERREKERLRREQAAESERQIKLLEEQLKRERLREENEMKKRIREEEEKREWEEQRRQAELERERRRLEEELRHLENEKKRAYDEERRLKEDQRHREDQEKRKREEEKEHHKRWNQNEEHNSERRNHLDKKGHPPTSHVTNKTDDTDRLRKMQKFKAPPRRIISRGEIETRYEIGRIIGDGNFAVVRECRLRNTESEFAMKIIDKSKLKEKVSMIENEIAIMKNCRHPNIVRLIEEFETKDEIYLILEYIKGGDLFDAITESVKFTERDAANMVADLSEALKFLHSKNIVHRDLKPENLLVSRNKDGSMTLKLADFGLAMEVTEPIYTVCGTPTYVAPEILAETGYGLEVDMWAMGVITYILLCGFPPFRSLERDQEELFEIIQLGDYEFLSPYWDTISQAAKDLIQRLLVVDTKRRYTAEQVLTHAWIQSEGAYKGPNLQREITMNLEKNFGNRGYRRGNAP